MDKEKLKKANMLISEIEELREFLEKTNISPEFKIKKKGRKIKLEVGIFIERKIIIKKNKELAKKIITIIEEHIKAKEKELEAL